MSRGVPGTIKNYCSAGYDILRNPRGKNRTCIISAFLLSLKKDEDGCTAFCPEVQGCYAQGDTYEEVLENIRDAVRLHIDERLESGEKIPQTQLINLTTVDVSV